MLGIVYARGAGHNAVVRVTTSVRLWVRSDYQLYVTLPSFRPSENAPVFVP